VIASNANDILPRTVATGVYATRGVQATSSPSMDIQVSSNFERYLFEACGRDASVIRAQMGALSQSGKFEIGAATQQLQAEFGAAAASEAQVAAAITGTQAASGYLAEPHTACGIVANEAVLKGFTSPKVILATAHPAKFPDAMVAITGNHPALPPRLNNLMTLPERMDRLPNDLAAVEKYVTSKARAKGTSS
jgi:threonine synthase